MARSSRRGTVPGQRHRPVGKPVRRAHRWWTPRNARSRAGSLVDLPGPRSARAALEHHRSPGPCRVPVPGTGVNARPVSAEAGADSDKLCLTTDRVRVTDIAWAAAVFGRRTTARQDVFRPRNPRTHRSGERPVELVSAEAAVDHDDPCRCSHTVRPDAAGETTPDRTTDSAGAAVDGLTPRRHRRSHAPPARIKGPPKARPSPTRPPTPPATDSATTD